MGKHRILALLLFLAVIVGTTACNKGEVAGEEPPVPVAVHTVSRGLVLCREEVSGVTKPQGEVYIVPQLGGEIGSVEVEVGDWVEKGQVLVRLRDTDMLLQVRQAEAGLEAAQAQLDRALAGASPEELTQLEAMVAQAEVGVEAALLNLYSSLEGFSPLDQQLRGAEAQYRQAQLAREQAENQLYQVMFGSGIEQADLGVEQARKGKKLLEDRLTDVKKVERNLVREIAEFEDLLSPNTGREDPPGDGDGNSGSSPDLGGTDTGTNGGGGEGGPDYSHYERLQQSLRETRAAISQLEMEIEMAKFQVDQAQVGRDQLLRETRKQAELALLQAEEGEAAARTQVQMLKKMAKQQESLALGQKKQAEASLEAAKAGLELAQKGAREEDLQAAGAGVKQARAAVALARSQLDKGILKAPIAGQATAVQAQVGELAGPGSPLLAIVNSQLLKVEFNLTERLINSVLPGDEVKIRFLTLPGREFTGIITTVSPAPDPRTGVFPAEAVLENAEGTLKPGLFADVELVVADSTGNLVIPQGALLEEGTEDYVYIVQGGRARRKPVSLGLSNGEKVEVLSGLSETDFLVVKGQHYLEDGGRVSIQEWSGGEGR